MCRTAHCGSSSVIITSGREGMTSGTWISRCLRSLSKSTQSPPFRPCFLTRLFSFKIIPKLSSSSSLVTHPGTSSGAPCHPLLPLTASYSRRSSLELSEGTGLKRSPQLFVVQPRLRPDTLLQSKLEEALSLANSLEQEGWLYFDADCVKTPHPHLVVQNPSAKFAKPHADTYFGNGTVETVRCHVDAAESDLSVVDAVFVNTVLSAVQQRNLERAWGKPVLDRIALIIDIFNAHAHTREAKLQAELASLIYKKSRLVRVRGSDGRSTFGGTGDDAEVVSARGKGSGGQGFLSGAGETELELQRRRILQRQNRLLSQIEQVRRTRAVQRASRRREGQGLPTVAVVGYTNAGKSTLVSALTDSDLYCDDRLFATVDPTLRAVILPSGRKALLSDTVGFISDLPVQLVEAFHATLEEVVEADLLLHVMDSSSRDVANQRDAVLHVLEKLGVSEEKMGSIIQVLNKADVKRDRGDHLPTDGIAPGQHCGVRTSALTGYGLRRLLQLIDQKLPTETPHHHHQPRLDKKWRPPTPI